MLMKFSDMLIALVIAGFTLYMIFLAFNHNEDHEAKPEELTSIIKTIPCAADEFRKALDPNATFNYRGSTFERNVKPLSLSEAKRLAKNCQFANDEAEKQSANEERVEIQREAIRNSGY